VLEQAKALCNAGNLQHRPTCAQFTSDTRGGQKDIEI
jgi:hypothetical protein